MVIQKRYKELGISDKEVFTDAEMITMPSLEVLYPLWSKHQELQTQKTAADAKLTVAENRNINLPDNSTRITELTNLLGAIDGATLLQQVEFKTARDEYSAEKENLEAEQTVIITTEIQAEIITLINHIAVKVTEVNAECVVQGIGDIL